MKLRITSWLAAAIAAGALSLGCYGDMVSTQPGGERFEGVPIDTSVPLDCVDPVASTDDGYHNPGSSCLSCHNGDIGPAFTSGGTLFADENGAVPMAGFSVSIIDATGANIAALTGDNGNFYTTDPIMYPAIAYVSACPDVVPMPIVLTLGDCNSCHVEGDRITFAPQ